MMSAVEQAVQTEVCRVRDAFPTVAAVAVAIASSVVIMLGGCASSAGIAPMAKPIAPASVGLVANAGAAKDGTANDGAAAALALAPDWWRAFGDPTLDGLIDRALAGDPNLGVARARLVRAQAAIVESQAAGRPQLDGEIDVTRQRFSDTAVYPPPIGGSTLTLGTAQLNGSWELDFFGRNRAAIEAAIGTQRAAFAELQASRVALAGNVARNYVQLARLFEQRRVAVRALQQRDATLALITQRVRGGLDTTVEQRQGEGALPETRQQIEQLDEQIGLVRHALAALTAQAPDALDSLTVPLDSLRAVALPEVVPADLLGRRADISAARWRIEAATSDVKNAKAQFYPNINLTAFVGLSSIGLNQLAKSGSAQYGVGPAIQLPIFDAGRLRANLSARTADLDAAVESYNGAVLDAVHDAADQLGSLRSVGRQQTEQVRAQAAAESAYDLALQRYKAGLATYLTVLNAEASVLNQRRLAVDLKARVLEVQIALARALGGGYAGDTQLAQRPPLDAAIQTAVR